MNSKTCLIACCAVLTPILRAELTLPAIIGDHMVLQQKQANPIWGWDTPGTKITVSFSGQNLTTTAGADGKWTVKLAPLPANANPQAISISGSSKREIADVLIGEVWMCSGQSNMEFSLHGGINGDIEAAASDFPNLRLIKVPRVGTQELQKSFKGQWQPANAASAAKFSAVGFLYGRYLHEILKVPVGLIDNSWGGSAAEAWIRRDTLDKEPGFKDLMEATVKREKKPQPEPANPSAESTPANPAPAAPKPDAWLTGNSRPGNIFAGVVHPTLGYGIKGVIWYQGESNADKAYQYRSLFPLMITQWRKEWGQGDFPFYWVQLADFRAEKPVPGDSAWAELREAQTLAMKLPNTGQAVIIDVGEGKDIHPRNKQAVAARLVRWALVKDYGLNFPYRSPEFKSLAISGNTATVSLDCFGSTLRAFDVTEARGFAICGEDKVWHPAVGKIKGADAVEVSSPDVSAPIAVRYAWADNPVCNLYSENGLPVTPFRTDDFEMVTRPKPPAPAPSN